MPEFAYKARERSGEVVEGSLDMQDRAAARLQIDKPALLGKLAPNTKVPCNDAMLRPGEWLELK